MPPRFSFDRVAAAICALFVVGNLVAWLQGNLRAAADPLGSVLTWWWIYAYYVGFTFLILLVLLGIRHSRRWAFITLFSILGVILLGLIALKRAGDGVINFLLWAYCAARIFGLLGPRPAKDGAGG